MKEVITDKHYDSELSIYENFAFLDLNINTYFNFVNVLAPFDKKRRLEQPYWTLKMQKDFTDKYVAAIDNVWNYKLWLSTNVSWGTDRYKQEFYINKPIICSIKIIPSRNKAKAHQKLKVLNRKPLKTDPGAAWMNEIGGGEGTLMIDSNDERNGFSVTEKIPAHDITSAHELGHFLGFEHIGVQREIEDFSKYNAREKINNILNGKMKCLQDTNDEICYKGDDVMGLTMTINKWHAKPWIQRMKKHLERSSKDLVFTVNLGYPSDAPVRLSVGP